MYFYTHATTKFVKVIKQSFNNFFAFHTFGIAQQVIYNLAESDPTIFLLWAHCFNELCLSGAVVSLVHQTHQLLFFHSLKTKTSGKCTYLKHSPPLYKLFTYCFIKPSLM